MTQQEQVASNPPLLCVCLSTQTLATKDQKWFMPCQKMVSSDVHIKEIRYNENDLSTKSIHIFSGTLLHLELICYLVLLIHDKDTEALLPQPLLEFLSPVDSQAGGCHHQHPPHHWTSAIGALRKHNTRKQHRINLI